MKIFALILFFYLPLHAEQTNQIHYNNMGFPICVEQENKTYFFEWDPFTRSEKKDVSYFEMQNYIQATGHFINGCDDAAYLHQIPSEILHPLSSHAKLFSPAILFSLKQVSEGGHRFHREKKLVDYINHHPEIFKADSPQVLSQLRYEGGDHWANQVITTWSKRLFASGKSCDQYIGSCDFYLCQEKNNPCGVDGYNLGFGYKYCSGSKFSLLQKMQTNLGKTWIQNVFTCLQKRSYVEAITAESPQTCEQIKTVSMNSHPNCYVSAGFCALKMDEKLKIFNLIKKEIFSLSTVSQGTEILKLCGDVQ